MIASVLFVLLALVTLVEINGLILTPKTYVRVSTALKAAPSGRTPAKGNTNNKFNNLIPNRGTQTSWQKRNDVSSAQRTWRSGDALVPKNLPENPNGRRRNDPWWMRDDEKNNPRILPRHNPWWCEHYKNVDLSWKVAELKAEAVRRGITAKGIKSDIIAQLQEQERRYSMSDENFTPAVFIAKSEKELNKCYPDVYESGEV